MNIFNRYIDPDKYPRYTAVYACLLLIGIVFLYRRFIFSDMMLGGGDMLATGVFFRSFLVDHVWRHGTIPLWNPYMFCGLPYVDAFHGDIFYPLSFLKYLGTIWRMLGFTLLLHIFLAGIFMYLAARQIGLSKLAATTAGIAYAFSGWLNGLTMPGHDGKMFVTALFPLTVFFLDRAFVRQHFLNCTMLGVTIGVIILTPHPQLAYYTLLLLFFYTVYRLIRHLKAIGRPLKTAGIGLLVVYAVALGVLISAIQMLPGFFYTKQSSVRTEREVRYEFATSFSLHQEEVISLFVPEFCGRDRLWENFRSYWGQNSFKDNSEYVGLVAMLLAIVGICYGKMRHRWFFGIMAGATLLYALGDNTPFFRWCYMIIPLIKSTRAPSTITFLFSFAVSILAGMGIDALRERGGTKEGFRFRVPLNILVYCVPCILLAGALAYTYAPDQAHPLYLTLFSPGLLENPGKMAYAKNNFPAMADGFWIAFAFAAAVAIIVKLSAVRRAAFVLLPLLPLLAMADGIRYNAAYIQLVDAEAEFTPSPLVRYIRDHAGVYRAFGFDLNEVYMQPYYHGIMSTIGYHGNQLRTYIELLKDRGPYTTNYARARFANLTGCRYIMIPRTSNLEPLGYDPHLLSVVAEHGKDVVVKNDACFPRAYLAGRLRVFSSIDSLAYALYDSDDDLRRTVYLTERPEAEIDSAVFPGDTAYIEHYGIDSIAIVARCATPKILTLSDNYYRDWRVFVDDSAKEPVITYGSFRGVVLNAGEHKVVWKYIPSRYRTGKVITGLTALYTIAGLAALLLMRRWRASVFWDCCMDISRR